MRTGLYTTIGAPSTDASRCASLHHSPRTCFGNVAVTNGRALDMSTLTSTMQVAVAELYDIAPRNFKPKDLLFGSVLEAASSYEPAPLEVRSGCEPMVSRATLHIVDVQEPVDAIEQCSSRTPLELSVGVHAELLAGVMHVEGAKDTRCRHIRVCVCAGFAREVFLDSFSGSHGGNEHSQRHRSEVRAAWHGCRAGEAYGHSGSCRM